jgi:hypothetical protein
MVQTPLAALRLLRSGVKRWAKKSNMPAMTWTDSRSRCEKKRRAWSAFDICMMFQGYIERGFSAEDGDIETLTRLLGHNPRKYADFAGETARAWKNVETMRVV